MNWCFIPRFVYRQQQSELARRLTLDSRNDARADIISDRITFALIGWVVGVLSSALVVWLARASVEGF